MTNATYNAKEGAYLYGCIRVVLHVSMKNPHLGKFMYNMWHLRVGGENQTAGKCQGRSKRYVLFHKAFELAFQRANEKWTEEDCASCFPLIHAAAPHLLQTIRQESIDVGRKFALEEEKKITETWGAADGIDALHKAILESRRRAAATKENPNDPNNVHKDTWRPTLDPHTAVRAVKVPLLRQELERLKNEIEEGTARNIKLEAEMRSNVAAQEAATLKMQTLLVGLEKTCTAVSELPLVAMEDWAFDVVAKGRT